MHQVGGQTRLHYNARSTNHQELFIYVWKEPARVLLGGGGVLGHWPFVATILWILSVGFRGITFSSLFARYIYIIHGESLLYEEGIRKATGSTRAQGHHSSSSPAKWQRNVVKLMHAWAWPISQCTFSVPFASHVCLSFVDSRHLH